MKKRLWLLLVPALGLSCHAKKLISNNDLSLTQSNFTEKKLPVNIRVLYGTDRERLSSKPGKVVYGDAPASRIDTSYEVGYTVVSIPPDHQLGKLERPSIWKLQFREDTLKHVVQRSVTLLSDTAFNSMLKQAKNGEDAFIFVHGYNNSFEEAALRTAQVTCDLSLPIQPIMYSWSSNAKVIDYPGDEDQVSLGTLNFVAFLKRVAKNGTFRHLHLISHSMGNRLVCNALYELRNDTANLKIDQIIMAAPDVFADEFQQKFASAIIAKSKHVTVYSAKNDEAIQASKFVHHDFRLGEISLPPPLYVFPGIDVIDATNQKMDLLGHGRFAQSPVILSDIETILGTDENAAQRKVQQRLIGTYIYYHF